MSQEESYELVRSNSFESFDDEEEVAQLLNKEDNDSDNDDYDEDFEPTTDYPLWRFICIGVSIGLSFLVFKLLMMALGRESHHKERGVEKLFHNGTDYFASTVILISLDGFRREYLDRNTTPNMLQFAQQGVMAEKMYPSFPPSTFPNHYTLVTGLYPESHGIVANYFYDPTTDETFSHTNDTTTTHSKWWKGQPIWLTSRINRKRSASIMWPGSSAEHLSPDYLIKYNSSMSSMEKMDITLGWLDLPYNTRPQMISIYIPQIDQEGHRGGPHSSKMNSVIKEADNAIGYLLEQLKRRNIEEYIHVVIVSDHGMTETSDTKLIYYDDILSKEVLEHIKNREASPLLDLRPSSDAPQGTIQKIYNQLYNYTQSVSNPHFQVFMREDVPERFHYSHSDRITPIVTIPDNGYTFVTHQDSFKAGGNHGYDNLEQDMAAIFMAKGPKIARAYEAGSILAPFYNVEVYGLLTELLNIDASSNNGTLEGVFPLVSSPKRN